MIKILFKSGGLVPNGYHIVGDNDGFVSPFPRQPRRGISIVELNTDCSIDPELIEKAIREAFAGCPRIRLDNDNNA